MSGGGMGETRDSIGGPANYYNTTLEPMQMLQSLRAGQPVVNHIYRPAQQVMPPSLPTAPYQQAPMQATGTPAVAQAPVTGWQSGTPTLGGGEWWAGPGGDGSPGGVGTDSGADGSGGGGGGGK